MTQKNDPNVAAVIQELLNREKTGFLKYGVTTERTDIDLYGWLQHLKEECLDSVVYITRIQSELKSLGNLGR